MTFETKQILTNRVNYHYLYQQSMNGRDQSESLFDSQPVNIGWISSDEGQQRRSSRRRCTVLQFEL